MGGEGVTQRVGVHPPPQPAEPRVSFEGFRHPAGGEPTASPIQEERIVSPPAQESTSHLEITVERLPCLAAQGDDSLLVSLSTHPRGPRGSIQVAEVEPAELRTAEPAPVEHLEDGAIAPPEGTLPGRGLQER